MKVLKSELEWMMFRHDFDIDGRLAKETSIRGWSVLISSLIKITERGERLRSLAETEEENENN